MLALQGLPGHSLELTAPTGQKVGLAGVPQDLGLALCHPYRRGVWRAFRRMPVLLGKSAEEVQGPRYGSIAFLSELSDEELTLGVRVVKGHHGNLEFQLKEWSLDALREVHIIVGNLSDFPAGC